MKIEKYIYITLISLLVLTLGIIFIKNYNTYSKMNDLTSLPFKYISILNNEISLSNEKRAYQNIVDCSNLKDENTQIVSYKLLDEYKDFLISIKTTILNDKEIVEEDFSSITELNTLISVTDKNKEYEQIFYINSVCK